MSSLNQSSTAVESLTSISVGNSLYDQGAHLRQESIYKLAEINICGDSILNTDYLGTFKTIGK